MRVSAVNDELRTGAANRYGHFALPQDSSDVIGWVRQHALEHGFEPGASQILTLQHFQRLYEDLIALERLEASLIQRTEMQTRDYLGQPYLP